MNRHEAPFALLLLALAACAAPNPQHTDLPAPWKPDPKSAAKSAPQGPAANAAASAGAGQAPTQDATSTDAPAAKPAPSGDASQAVAPGDAVLARVGGDVVTVSELLAEWLYLDPIGARTQLDNVIMRHIVYLEGQRLRVRLDPEEDAKAYEAGVKFQESEIARKSPGVSLDRYVDRAFGLDPIWYRDRLREDTRRQILEQRVMRAWLLQQEHVELHAIVVESEEGMQAVQAELASGRSFEDVARERSLDKRSKENGGAITPLVNSEQPIAKLAFDTQVGQIGGPVVVAGKYVLVRVDARPAPITGTWAQIGATVEQSLKDRPIEPDEQDQWRVAMLRRYEVDVRSFMSLTHQSGG